MFNAVRCKHADRLQVIRTFANLTGFEEPVSVEEECSFNAGASTDRVLGHSNLDQPDRVRRTCQR